MDESNYNKDSVDCVRLPGPIFPPGKRTPGEFIWGEEEEGDHRYLYIVLPGGSSSDAIKCHRGAPGGERVWGWDGNLDKPTLAPSIHWQGVWHGHLEAGRLKSC